MSIARCLCCSESTAGDHCKNTNNIFEQHSAIFTAAVSLSLSVPSRNHLLKHGSAASTKINAVKHFFDNSSQNQSVNTTITTLLLASIVTSSPPPEHRTVIVVAFYWSWLTYPAMDMVFIVAMVAFIVLVTCMCCRGKRAKPMFSGKVIHHTPSLYLAPVESLFHNNDMANVIRNGLYALSMPPVERVQSVISQLSTYNYNRVLL